MRTYFVCLRGHTHELPDVAIFFVLRTVKGVFLISY